MVNFQDFKEFVSLFMQVVGKMLHMVTVGVLMIAFIIFVIVMLENSERYSKIKNVVYGYISDFTSL